MKVVSAVHISELPDPTPYLTGGEMLLTTGLTLPASKMGCEKYVARLAGVGISALGLGLGPVHTDIPDQLVEACQSFGVTLLEIPASTPFMAITKAYWTAVSRLTEQHLNDAVATHRALVNAAVSQDPTASMLRTLARTLNGWAAVISPSGAIQQVFPLGMYNDAEAATGRVSRLRITGVRSAASFPVADHVVALYPLPIENRIVGYLAVGTPRGLNATDRGIVTTACALLSLDFAHRERNAESYRVSLRPIALLIDMGSIDAARRLGARLGSVAFDNNAKVLVARTSNLSTTIRVVDEWCADAVGVPIDKRHCWFLIPSEHPPLAGLKSSLKETEPSISAIISHSLELRDVGGSRIQMSSRIDELPDGELQFQNSPVADLNQDLERKVASLADYHQADLTATLIAFLRHRGQWELSARTLGAHRNTVRNRIAKCESILGYSLDEPDVCASLWLLLRRKGLA